MTLASASAAADHRAGEIRSARFRAEREAGWKRLDELVRRVESRGARALSYDEALELTGLYRHAMNGLSAARAISMDRALLVYLEALCARAASVVYAPQAGVRGSLARAIARDIPRAMRANAAALAVGFAALWIGALLGYWLTGQDSAWYDSLVPGGLAGGRGPGASVETLRASLFQEDGEHGPLGLFASYLFQHNTQIAILVFALGIFAALPTIALTFANGLTIGAFFQVFVAAGLGREAFGWLSIHGVTELSAICIAAAGGTRLGLAVLSPGPRGRAASLREGGEQAVMLIAAAALMLIVAALVEGFARQLVQNTGVRLAVGWGLGACWLAWFTLAGRGEER